MDKYLLPDRIERPVYKSNDFIISRYYASRYSLRMIELVGRKISENKQKYLKLINEQLEVFRRNDGNDIDPQIAVTLEPEDYLPYVRQGHNIGRDVEDTISSLNGLRIQINTQDDFIIYTPFNKAKYNKATREILVIISLNAATPFFWGLDSDDHNGYTIVSSELNMGYNSQYSLRISDYCLMFLSKDFENTNVKTATHTESIDAFKLRVGIDYEFNTKQEYEQFKKDNIIDDKRHRKNDEDDNIEILDNGKIKWSSPAYKKISNLRNRILDIAVNEINSNNKSCIEVSYELKREGRTFKNIIWTASYKETCTFTD